MKKNIGIMTPVIWVWNIGLFFTAKMQWQTLQTYSESNFGMLPRVNQSIMTWLHWEIWQEQEAKNNDDVKKVTVIASQLTGIKVASVSRTLGLALLQNEQICWVTSFGRVFHNCHIWLFLHQVSTTIPYSVKVQIVRPKSWNLALIGGEELSKNKASSSMKFLPSPKHIRGHVCRIRSRLTKDPWNLRLLKPIEWNLLV